MIKVKNVSSHAVVLGAVLMVIAPMAVAAVDGEDGGVKDMLAQGKLVKLGETDPQPLKDPEKMTVAELVAEIIQFGASAHAGEGKAVLVKRLTDYRSGGLEL